MTNITAVDGAPAPVENAAANKPDAEGVENKPVETETPADTVTTAAMKPVTVGKDEKSVVAEKEPAAEGAVVAEKPTAEVDEKKSVEDEKPGVEQPVVDETKTADEIVAQKPAEGLSANEEKPVEKTETADESASKEHTDLPAPLPTGPAPKEPVDLDCTTKASSKVLSPSAAVYIPPSVLAQKAAIAAGLAPTGSHPPATPTRRPPTSNFMSSTPRTPVGSGGRTPSSARGTRTSPRTVDMTPSMTATMTPGGTVVPVELTAKQVRELRRLCRKTANRAEYEGRLVQLRQIASILAMGGPSLVHFAPSYLTADSALQSWLDLMRGAGADWRDERPLGAAAVEELREWDRLLKAWARRRFPTLETAEGGAAPPTTPRSKRLDLMSLTSPVAGDTPSPRGGMRTPGSNRANRGIQMSRGEDVIHITIVRGDDGRVQVGAGPETPGSWRSGSPNRELENVSPNSEEAKNRDWGTLRRNEAAGGGGGAVAPVALKARNW